tara:strand:+ start:1597 stop:2298 length:702 start_codon:yes stop_codon:yes gene_type:complete
MTVFGAPWVEAIQEQAQSIAKKKNIPDNVFHSLRPYILESKYIVWEVSEAKRLIQLDNGERYLDIFEPDKIMLKMESGKYIYLWAEIHGLATALLTEELSVNSQHILYRELEVKHAKAEINQLRAMKPKQSKHNEALQEVINTICNVIKPEKGVFGQTKLDNWLFKNAKEYETANPDCDDLNYVSGIGESANKERGEFEQDTLTWLDSTGSKHSISISSLKPYFKKFKAKKGS